MKTKKFLSLILAAAAAVSFAGCSGQKESDSAAIESNSQDTVVYKIGVTQYADHPSLDNCREGFIQGLEESGLKEGEDFEIDFQSAQGDNNIAQQVASKFASDKKDIVCGIATPSAQALYAACFNSKIPVIFNAVSDPVAAKLAKSETETLSGISGVSDALPVEDQLKLIREFLPDAKKIGIVYTTSEANSVSTIETYKELAPKYDFEIVEKGIAKQAEMPAALDVLLPQVDCISNMTDNTVVAALGVLLDKANAANIPVFGSEEEQVKNGCIASAGLDYIELGKKAGAMAAKVLKGEDISNLPFETMDKAKITVNKTTASKLNIAVPADIDAELVE